MQQENELESRFHAVLPVVVMMLQRERRITYRELRHVFGIDDVLLEAIKQALQFKRLAADEEREGLVWLDETVSMPVSVRSLPDAERRQLTVMFCDLVGSTDLSGKLDPEDLRDVVRAYQETAAEVIQRYEGHIAQYLGDGLLIYFGYPIAHENDAQLAVYTGLGIPQAMARLNMRLTTDYGVQLAVRIGIHTGPVVVGEMGGGGRHENLALGETPNITARLEGLAQANTAVISPVTAQLVQGSFILEELGLHALKGVADPMMLYTAVAPREADADGYEAMLAGGFDDLVGRTEEIGLLLRRWQQSQESQGQVVLISGEAGLGKSSLVEGLRSHVHEEGYTRIAFRCSPYTANSALHPVIEQVQRVLGWQREDPAETKLAKLEQRLASARQPLEESVPLIAALLSLPLPETRYPVLTLTPAQQRQQTQDTLVAWMLAEAERQPVLAVWEDLHWADPSTLELLGLLIDQTPTAPMMNVLVFRPEFAPPWPHGPHLTPITLSRLERAHIEAFATRLAQGKALPAEVMSHIVTKTDGVPLYVEELTKMLLESELLLEESEQYVLTGPLSTASIPTTLQASLMARLDRLPRVREVAQLGAVLGREFTYEMLQALTVIDEPALQEGLTQLVDHGLLYQRGRMPRAKYMFRHALIRDAAYESLLRRTRQHYHQEVAQLLEARFADTVEMQPELVAHHYTEASCAEPAITYWQRAGQRAAQRSASQEAVSHFGKGLEVLALLPDTPERIQLEFDLLMGLGPALIDSKSPGSPEVEQTYARAMELCQHLGETPQRFPVIHGLWRYYNSQAAPQTSRLAEQLLTLAERDGSPEHLSQAHQALGYTLLFLGEISSAHAHLEQAIRPANRAEERVAAIRSGTAPGVYSRIVMSVALWYLGYPDQALQNARDAQLLAQDIEHPGSLASALYFLARIHYLRREVLETLRQAEALVTLATEHPFPHWEAMGILLKGWFLVYQGQGESGLEQMRQGFRDVLTAGGALLRLPFLLMQAEACCKAGEAEAGLYLLEEARAEIDKSGRNDLMSEAYRINGDLLLNQAMPGASQAEACFQQALDIARQQEAKSWELRAATSLARLWRQQGKREEAHELLAPVYEWFTEGFQTADLIEAKQLLDDLSADMAPQSPSHQE